MKESDVLLEKNDYSLPLPTRGGHTRQYCKGYEHGITDGARAQLKKVMEWLEENGLETYDSCNLSGEPDWSLYIKMWQELKKIAGVK